MVAQRQEQRIGVLQKGAGVAHHGMAQHAQLVDQRARRNDVAQPQRGRQALGQRPHIDHTPALVQALERGHGRALVEVLGLVVVLDDHEIALLGAAQQLLAPLQAQRHGGGALVRGRDEQVVQRRQAIDHHAFLVHGHGHPVRAAQRKGVARMRVAGLLEAQALRGVQQRVGQQVEGLLRAHGDQDLFLEREHAAPGQQAQADLLDQVGHVVGLEVRRPVRQLGARQAARAAFPEAFGGKQRGIVHAVDEGVGVLAPLQRLGQRVPVRQRAQHACRPVRCGLPGTCRRQGHGAVHTSQARIPGHEHAAARAGFQKAFIHELLVDRGHGIARHLQQARQLARGRHGRAGRQAAFEDGLDQGQAQAVLQGKAGLLGQREQAGPLVAWVCGGRGAHGATEAIGGRSWRGRAEGARSAPCCGAGAGK